MLVHAPRGTLLNDSTEAKDPIRDTFIHAPRNKPAIWLRCSGRPLLQCQSTWPRSQRQSCLSSQLLCRIHISNPYSQTSKLQILLQTRWWPHNLVLVSLNYNPGSNHASPRDTTGGFYPTKSICKTWKRCLLLEMHRHQCSST